MITLKSFKLRLEMPATQQANLTLVRLLSKFFLSQILNLVAVTQQSYKMQKYIYLYISISNVVFCHLIQLITAISQY